MITTKNKVCTKCGFDKPISEYYSYIDKRDNKEKYMATCKDCKKEYQYNRRRKLGQIKGTYGTSRFDYMLTENKKYGKWTIIGDEVTRNKRPQILCRCDCGTEKLVHADRLESGTSRGCIPCVRRRTDHLGQTYWTKVVEQAKSRNIEVDITMEQADELFQEQNGTCALTGIDLTFGYNNGKTHTKSQKRTASLDRIDSTKGYVEGNVHWVHKHVNIMKNRYSLNHFIDICKRVVEYYD